MYYNSYVAIVHIVRHNLCFNNKINYYKGTIMADDHETGETHAPTSCTEETDIHQRKL